MKKTLKTMLTVTLLSTGALAVADGHIGPDQLKGAMEARQAHMNLYSFNLGILGAMAKEEAPYDAAIAGAAASSLATLTALSQANYWLPGSDSASLEGSRALPDIWTAESRAGEIGQALATAAAAMETAATTDLDSLKAAMGPIGQACGDCHRSYRVRNN